MKQQLLAILEKYSFIHIDQKGELSILVPLTGASPVIDNFTNNGENPVALYLFGDNTCQADIERRKFFQNNRFTTSFSNLIKELEQLKTRHRGNSEKEFIQVVIDTLKQNQSKAEQFSNGNPGEPTMLNDLRGSNQGFVTKGEFLVAGNADQARYLNLPNILNLASSTLSANQKMIGGISNSKIVNHLGQIPRPKNNQDLATNLAEIIQHLGLAHCRQRLSHTPKQLFQEIYQLLQVYYPSIANQPGSFYDVLVENLQAVCGTDENYSTWSAEDIVDNIKLVLDVARVIDTTPSREDDKFSTVFYDTLKEFSKQRTSTGAVDSYKLFVIQTFLYLCALQLRLNAPQHAENFLKALQAPTSAEKLIQQLCQNEDQFAQMMHETYGLSTEQYKILVKSTRQIALDHLEAPHFDELRLACMSSHLQNIHYLILGGCLCWSTVPITENSNINSAEQQKNNRRANFEIFYTQMEESVERRALLQSLQEFIKEGAEYEEIALDSLTNNFRMFTEKENKHLLELSIKHKKYRCTAFLINNGIHNEQLFQEILKQIPLNISLIEAFIVSDDKYAAYFNAERLAKAIKDGQVELVKLILTHDPRLLEAKLINDSTPFLLACEKGNVELVDYLMELGADTLVKQASFYSENNLTAKQCAQKTSQSRAILELFNTYSMRLRRQLELNPNHQFAFLSEPDYLVKAIEQKEFLLVDFLLEHFPDLQESITRQHLIDAIKNNSLETVRQILNIRPALLNETDTTHQTALFYACKEGHAAIVAHLINAGAELFIVDNGGRTARDWAESIRPQNAKVQVLELFNQAYQELAPNSEGYGRIFNADTFKHAFAENDYLLVDCILQRCPQFTNEINGTDLFAAIKHNNLERVKNILKYRPDLLEYKQPSTNQTPFLFACRKGKMQIAEYLLDNGADVHAGEIVSISTQTSAVSYSGHPVLRIRELMESNHLYPQVNTLLSKYNEELEDKLINKQGYRALFTADHLVQAIDARNLTFVDVLLNYRPDLKTQLNQEDWVHINQQRTQKEVSEKYNQLLTNLQKKRQPFFLKNHATYSAMLQLHERLIIAGNEFFNTHVSHASVEQFKQACAEAIEEARPVLASHRGWHGYPLFVRAILGIIAAITVIPAIVVQATTAKGYVGTFFKSYETDSVQKLQQFETDAEALSDQIAETIAAM